MVSITHLADDERYRWLNDVVCVGAGEVRSFMGADGTPTGEADLVIDVTEVLWEPILDL